MFSIMNNNLEIIFAFSNELRNNSGVELARNFLKKGELNLETSNLEQLVRRGIFPNMPRKQIEKLSLKIFRVIHNLSKSEMVNYGVELREEWQIYGSNCDIIKALVRRKEVKNERIRGRGFVGFPTYYPDYLRSVV